MKLQTSLDRFRDRNQIKPGIIRGRRWGVLESKAVQGKRNTGKPALLMLPGTLGNADIFWNQFTALGRELRMISVGYPLTDDLEAMVGDLVRLLDRYGIERTSVLGSSFGGFAAQTLAEAVPDRMETLFISNSLTDTSLTGPNFPTAEVLRMIPPRDLRAHMSPQIKAAKASIPTQEELKPLLLRELHEVLPPRGPKLRLAALFGANRIPAPQIARKQVVVIDSTDDPLIAPPIRADVVKRYRGAERHRFDVGGHFPYITRHAEYTDILRRRLL